MECMANKIVMIMFYDRNLKIYVESYAIASNESIERLEMCVWYFISIFYSVSKYRQFISASCCEIELIPHN